MEKMSNSRTKFIKINILVKTQRGAKGRYQDPSLKLFTIIPHSYDIIIQLKRVIKDSKPALTRK